ncbi:MAG: hypothetical protein IJA07_02990 [Agathobacter sp.]|nr:hypothetical protein [Agathobacter sp.]
MEKSMNEILIETTVNQAIKRIQDDPERSTRNLIDIGLHFSEGRFQLSFLQLAQKMLEDEQSAYYRMIPDVMANVDGKRIVTFGMNVGYHSCTKGARKIREIEELSHFNIPWCISLEMESLTYWQHSDDYHKLLEDGEALGIYTWIIYSLDDTHHLLELAEDFPDSAFIFSCAPKEITDNLLDEASNLYNIMFAVEYSEGIEEACQLLRNRKFLYSVLYNYGANDKDTILNGQILMELETLHPIFSFFKADMDCPFDIQTDIYHYVRDARLEQNYQTLPFDIIYDNLFIDSIVSDDSIALSIDANGNSVSCNLFEQSIVEILKLQFPKKS